MGREGPERLLAGYLVERESSLSPESDLRRLLPGARLFRCWAHPGQLHVAHISGPNFARNFMKQSMHFTQLHPALLTPMLATLPEVLALGVDSPIGKGLVPLSACMTSQSDGSVTALCSSDFKAARHLRAAGFQGV